MTLFPVPPSFFLFRKSAKVLYKLLIPLLLTVLFSTQLAVANEDTAAQFSTEFRVLNEDNLGNYVATVSQQYYRQLELLRHYFQLYRQKHDPRGFNIWHLKGFLPEFETFNRAQQHVAADNQYFLTGHTAKTLATMFAELREVSVNLLLALREGDPAAYHAASVMVKEHGEQLTTILREHQLEEHIRDISLD